MELDRQSPPPSAGPEVIDWILDVFRTRGDSAYVGEPVSQTEHALQAAFAAEQSGAGSALIAAALLHDIGHLLHELGEDCADHGIDSRHEELGAHWLANYFGPEVVEPIRLHVPAKRYLCATQPEYLNGLSPASLHSLQLQGGPFTSEEASTFRAGPHAAAALTLRQWDELAKIPGLKTPDLDHFRTYLYQALASTNG
jgi:[1-hydroxy-2-(trimethylamino)ethyl]phosphonate dioxygenase